MAAAEGHRKLFPTDWSTYIHTSPIAQLLLLKENNQTCYDIDNTPKEYKVIPETRHIIMLFMSLLKPKETLCWGFFLGGGVFWVVFFSVFSSFL